MQPFVTITVISKNPENPNAQFICLRDSLFNLVWILDKSSEVIAFEVSENGQNLTCKDYSWGCFTKWVLLFTKEHYKNS